MSVVKLLESIPLFSGLSEPERRELAVIVRDRTFERGQTIFAEGQEASGFYVVAAGRVKVYKISPDGKEQILHLLGPGEPFGEVALFSGRAFPAFAEAFETSRVFFIPREGFAAQVRAHPSLALNMLATLSMRLHQFANMIEGLSLREVSSRLAGYILSESGKQGGAARVELDLAKGQLASLLGTIPETLSRTLTRMVRQGLVRADGPFIEIEDREGLEQLASAERRLSDFPEGKNGR